MTAKTTALLRIAGVGLAHSFFGHLYEAVVKIPDRFAKDHTPGAPDRRMPSLRSPGSPLRYFVLAAPATVVATVAATVTGWQDPHLRRWLATAAVGTLGEDAVTAYIVRKLNARLFVAGQPITPEEQDRLVKTWYRLNALRLVLSATAWTATTVALDRTGHSRP